MSKYNSVSRYLLVMIIACFAGRVDTHADDRVVRFPKLSHYGAYSVIRMDAYRSVITLKDMKEDRFPEKRGVVEQGILDNSVFVKDGVSSVRIPAGHAISIGAVIPDAGGDDLVPINLSFLDGLADNDLCVLDVSRNVLTCQQIKSLNRFIRLVELSALVAKDCDDPRCLDGLKALEVLHLGLGENQVTPNTDAWVAAAVKHKSLKTLQLDGLRPNDRHLKTLSSLTKLERLQLNSAKSDVTNQGLAELTALKELREVVLHVAASVTDDGLKPFFEMRRLEKLVLGGSISVAAAKRLQLAHPTAEFDLSLRRE